MSKPSAKEVILSYVKAAAKGVSLPAKDGKEARTTRKCHTVFFRPVVDGKKMKGLNETLRDLGYDPIVESQKLIKAGVIYGNPIKGGFSLSEVSERAHSEKKSTTSNFALLEKLLGEVNDDLAETE